MKKSLSVFIFYTILLFYTICILSCSIIDSISKEQEEHKGDYNNGQLVTSFFHKYYPYTTYNQSIAVWDDMVFCFNDTFFADAYGFCVVINANSGNVIDRISEVPYVVSTKGGGAVILIMHVLPISIIKRRTSILYYFYPEETIPIRQTKKEKNCMCFE